MENSITHSEGGTVFAGRLAVDCYRAIVIANGLEMYARTGMKPNRAYTPQAMIRAAEQMTGKKFKARAYLEAAQALRATAAEVRGHIAAEAEGR